MRVTLVLALLLVAAASGAARRGLAVLTGAVEDFVSVGCERDVSSDFNRNYHSFCINLFKLVASHYKGNVAISPYSIWLSFAAIAEGLTGSTQTELLDVLKLPKEPCLRLKYYEIATKLETSGEDTKFDRKRYLVTGDGVRLNVSWTRAVRAAGLLDTASSAFNAYPEETKMLLKELISPTIVNKIGNLSRKSIVLDSFSYSALWSTAFPEESIARNKPFHNDAGEQIGTVDMYKIKRRVKLAYLPLLDLRVLELGVGAAGRYRLLLATRLSRRPIADRIAVVSSSIIADIVSLLQDSLIPLEIAIPRFNISFDISNVREIMEELGVKSLWAEANLTQYVSEPAALLGAYVQRVTLNMDNNGVEVRLDTEGSDPLKSIRDLATGVATMVGKGFIADKPFFYILLDSETNSCHFIGVYSTPTHL